MASEINMEEGLCRDGDTSPCPVPHVCPLLSVVILGPLPSLLQDETQRRPRPAPGLELGTEEMFIDILSSLLTLPPLSSQLNP
ncbi:hypothetical protein PoB_003724200 [Plakobranchus ocellatus]|uniref:Uncharacterized protein n=1 Tax=Plakobranchus ocellatus TaxID=259542 RepID=A0AAV4AUQ5_9GAST|nr:hypothetical protein PoB_003724200 [Plakobranchus ocellatus]